jgi:hypothetical protein
VSNIQAWTGLESDVAAFCLVVVLVLLTLVLFGVLLRSYWTEHERERRLALLDALAAGGGD